MSKQKNIQLEHQKESLAQGVFRTLRNAILDGTLKPGEPLRQESLAVELDVSQTTIRDALNQLIGDGLAIRIPYKGARVVTLSANDVEDIYEMRAALEGMAAREAAEHITAEELAEMRRILPESFVTEDQASVARAREMNRKFHEVFINASRRQYLIRILRQLWDWIDPLMLYSRTMQTEMGIETRIKWGKQDRYQHKRILDALEAGNGEQASKVATEAVLEAWDNLAEIIFENQDETIKNDQRR